MIGALIAEFGLGLCVEPEDVRAGSQLRQFRQLSPLLPRTGDGVTSTSDPPSCPLINCFH